EGRAPCTIVDDDGPPGQELVHGSRELHTLAALPGGVSNPTLFRFAQQPNASYEVVVDGASGDVVPIVLERLAADQSTMLQAGVATGTGTSVALRWENRGPAVADQWIRVRSGGCASDCGADDVYRVQAFETTASAPRFVAVGGQATVLVLQNRSSAPLTGH